MANGDNRDYRISFGHVLSIAIFLIGHLGTAIWFGSSLSSDMRHLRKSVDVAVTRIERVANEQRSDGKALIEVNARLTSLERLVRDHHGRSGD